MLEQIFQKYTSSNFIYTTEKYKTFGGQILAMKIRRDDFSNCFDVHIGTDVYPTSSIINMSTNLEAQLQATSISTQFDQSVPITNDFLGYFKPVAKIAVLTFFLCTEDLNEIKSSDKINSFKIKTNINEIMDFSCEVPRRDNALLGNKFLNKCKCSSIKHNNLEIYFDFNIHKLESITWNDLKFITLTIHQQKYLAVDAYDADSLNSIYPNDFIFDIDTTERMESYEREL